MGATAAIAIIAAAGTAYSAKESRDARKDQEGAQRKAKREAQRIEDEKPKQIGAGDAARRRAVVGANMLGRSDTILTGPSGVGQRSSILGG